MMWKTLTLCSHVKSWPRSRVLQRGQVFLGRCDITINRVSKEYLQLFSQIHNLYPIPGAYISSAVVSWSARLRRAVCGGKLLPPATRNSYRPQSTACRLQRPCMSTLSVGKTSQFSLQNKMIKNWYVPVIINIWGTTKSFCNYFCFYRRVSVGFPSRVILGQIEILNIKYNFLQNDSHGSQDERHKQIHVDVVPGTVQLPGKQIQEECNKALIPEQP